MSYPGYNTVLDHCFGVYRKGANDLLAVFGDRDWAETWAEAFAAEHCIDPADIITRHMTIKRQWTFSDRD